MNKAGYSVAFIELERSGILAGARSLVSCVLLMVSVTPAFAGAGSARHAGFAGRSLHQQWTAGDRLEPAVAEYVSELWGRTDLPGAIADAAARRRDRMQLPLSARCNSRPFVCRWLLLLSSDLLLLGGCSWTGDYVSGRSQQPERLMLPAR